MMTLAQASAYFDKVEVTDPFTGVFLFRGQVDPFDDTKRDAYSAYRRVLSTAPSVALPAHGTLNLLGQTWLVGDGEPDGMQELHRRKYVLSPAPETLSVSTLGQYLVGQSSAQVRAAAYWNRDAKQAGTSSEQPQLYDVLTHDAPAPRRVLWDSGQAFLVLSPRPVASGLGASLSLRLDLGVESATLTRRVFSPVDGAFTSAQTSSVQALRVRWQSLFKYETQADPHYRDGDVSIVMPLGLGVDTSSRLTFADAAYQVLDTSTLDGALVVHARRA